MAISLSTEAGLAGDYPSVRFNARERKLLESVKTYVDAGGDISIDELNDVTITSAADAHLLIYDNGDSRWENKAMSGDVTITAAGVAAIAAGVIVNADVNASAAIAYSKLALTGSIVNADIGASAAIAYSKLALSNSLVAGDLTSGSVTLAKLASGVSPSHVVKYAGTFTTAGGDAAEQISVAGVLGTDIAIVVLHTKGVTPRTILTAQAGTDVIDLEFSGDPSTDHVVRYMVLRAAA